MMPMTGGQRLRAWSVAGDKDYWAGLVWVGMIAVAAVVDGWLLYKGELTISERIWAFTALHPALIAFGVIGAWVVAQFVRRYFWMVFVTAFLGGHLFGHW